MIRLIIAVIMGTMSLGFGQSVTFNNVQFCNCIHEPEYTMSYWFTGCVGAPCLSLNGTSWPLHNHLPLPWTHGFSDGDVDTMSQLNNVFSPHNHCDNPDVFGPDNFFYIEAGYSDGSNYTNEPPGWYIVAYSTHPVFYAFGLTYNQFHGGTIRNQSYCGSMYLKADFNQGYAGGAGGACRITGIP